MTMAAASTQCLCGAVESEVVFVYDGPPDGETRFDVRGGSYHREVVRCGRCGHYRSLSRMDLGSLYEHDYVSSTYGGLDGVRSTFERINALPPEQSDNAGRVRRVVAYADAHLPDAARRNGGPRLLDVGSGLGVFPYRMRAAGWQVTAIEPDARLAGHARDVVGVDAICGSFGATPIPGAYDVITFNKILEHVEDPVSVLSAARGYLRPGGFVYIELPDGEMAEPGGPGREEFFIEHLHVFSAASTALLARNSGFHLSVLERLREPSTKYTLRAFLTTDAES
jgi:SAM-dependent methyltransferase